MNITFATIAAALVTLAAPALAQSASAVVSYADLNLASSAGRSTLAHRVDRAAAQVCGMTNGSTDLATSQMEKRCRIAAVMGAQKSMAQTPQYASR